MSIAREHVYDSDYSHDNDRYYQRRRSVVEYHVVLLRERADNVAD